MSRPTVELPTDAQCVDGSRRWREEIAELMREPAELVTELVWEARRRDCLIEACEAAEAAQIFARYLTRDPSLRARLNLVDGAS